MLRINRFTGGHLIVAIIAIGFYGCSGGKNEPTDTPTSGEVNIVVD